ncbi:MAG: EamA/RhaT family transporter, partial [Gordonia sp. (in: high G+C Gram-positive bacteria)]
MVVGIVVAVIGSLAFAGAAVLQALGADRTTRKLATLDAAESRCAAPTPTSHPSLRSTALTMATRPFLIGLVLDVVGFVATIASARLIPLFLSQSIIAARLVVTAVLALVFLGLALRIREWIAGIVVIAALVLLAAGAGPEGRINQTWMHWAVLAAGFVFFALGIGLARVLTRHIAATTGLVAGALFGVMAVASRILDGVSPYDITALFTDPALYALAFTGVSGFYLFIVALQTGSVNGAAAALVVGETVVPGAVGILLLGDGIEPGWGVVTGLSFTAAVIGG